MQIKKGAVVTLTYQVKNQDNIIVDEATQDNPLVYLHGMNNLISGLENQLEGLKINDSFDAFVKANDAYGEYNDNFVQQVDKHLFETEEELEVGMRFLADTDNGSIPVEITAVDETTVTVDGNHMLAGQNLSFTGKILDIREATSDELAHGHIHNHQDHDDCCGDHSCGCSH